MEKERVLFVSQEITPYLPETPMSYIGRYLPQGIQEKGREIRTFMPRFGNINERRNQLHEVIRLSGMNLIISDSDHPLIIKVASIQSARMQIYFIDNEDYFHRKFTVKDDDDKVFEDNDERAIFFTRGVLGTVKKLRWAPNIVHCQGWFTALTPLYIKKAFREDPLFNDTKVIFSVYDDDFNGSLSNNFKKKALIDGISEKDLSIMSSLDYVSVMKLAIKYSDGIIIGSEKINSKVLDYIKSTDKPVLEYQDLEHYIDAYSGFYDSVLTPSCVEI
ncbi:MAG: glycogen synthase [Bacteroidetes bacterium CG02_land_8_20_14_3_00_31_25]|nr:glycogen/starch synthase [Bacteroidota bacterium]PIV57877.1 MAG: glycogen synthase [Bacteroidetes bacterium CG02_land_8_20_14_3_00_31_25]PIX32816.1 MAG: glycogen synthase [Bacteroidetes bacterium CG_4_8_14_3_um_filter_31_14]PIY03923.1 MAG: glycogen synthase [Bacteroidetes bacterium CG_4_10_14_3_um_filter_31_20]